MRTDYFFSRCAAKYNIPRILERPIGGQPLICRGFNKPGVPKRANFVLKNRLRAQRTKLTRDTLAHSLSSSPCLPLSVPSAPPWLINPAAPPAHPASPALAEPHTRYSRWNQQFVGLFVASIRVLTMTPHDVKASWPRTAKVRGPRSEDGASRPSISDLSPSGARNDAPTLPSPVIVGVPPHETLYRLRDGRRRPCAEQRR